MNTRKNRKRTWKVQEQEYDEVIKETAATVVNEKPEPVKGEEVAQQQQQPPKQNQDSNPLLLFLQSWQECKEEQIRGTLQKDMPESISKLMSNKGYPISVNLARTKIMKFIKKYNLVKKMAANGKPIEWTHFNTVKKILEFGPPIIPAANVAIPIDNIKEEKECLKENTLKIAERKVSVDAQQPSSSMKQEKGVDLIEIGDDDTHFLEPRVYFSESEHPDDSDESDTSDEDLDFDNPLDKITFGFTGENRRPKQGLTPLLQQPPAKMTKLEKQTETVVSFLNRYMKQNPEQKQIAQPLMNGIQLRPTLPPNNKQQIIPIPQNLPKMPITTANGGTPQQFLIVRPINAGPNAKTIAIPMVPNQNNKTGVINKTEEAPINNAQQHILKSPDTKPIPANNHIKFVNLPKSASAVPPMTVRHVTETSPPPLVSTGAHPINTTGIHINNQGIAQGNASPGSAASTDSPTIRRLLTKVINLETNIYNIQKERLQLERERFDMERDYGKELISVFKEIKDKLCDIIPARTSTADRSPAEPTSNLEKSNSEVEHQKE